MAEKKLWVVLREQAKFRGLKFRRQQAVHPFIADFACMEVRLLIELDGVSHDARRSYDRMREQDLRQRGFSILRFGNEEVKNNVEGVVMKIVEQAERLRKKAGHGARRSAPLPNPPHKGEGIPPALAAKEG